MALTYARFRLALLESVSVFMGAARSLVMTPVP